MEIKNLKKADMSRIEKKISELEESVKGYSFDKEHQKKIKRLKDFVNFALEKKDTESIKDEISELCYASRMQSDLELIPKLKKTLQSDCYFIETDYVLTDGQLFNPSGFLPEDRVFIFLEASTAIGVNELPKKSNLNYFDLRDANSLNWRF